MSEFISAPITVTSFGSLTAFSIYTAIVLAVLSSGAKGNLLRFAETSSRTTVTTVLAIFLILLGLLTASDLISAEIMGTDPWLINLIVDTLRDPPTLGELTMIGMDSMPIPENATTTLSEANSSTMSTMNITEM